MKHFGEQIKNIIGKIDNKNLKFIKNTRSNMITPQLKYYFKNRKTICKIYTKFQFHGVVQDTKKEKKQKATF